MSADFNVVFWVWNFDQRSPSTSDVHLGLWKAARGWLKAVAALSKERLK